MIDRPQAAPQRMVWGVAALLAAVTESLNTRFAVCVVAGELSGFTRASSGHCYFSLKDANGQTAMLRCAMFRRAASLLDFAPADGALVEMRGRLTLYEPRGELQFVVEGMRRAGAGALYEQFLRLKAKLDALGLFDAAAKRPLPAFPQRLGVITSTAGAALHDVVTALARRAPHVEVIIYPSVVQGEQAPAALVAALQTANARAEVDALLLVRGGGSLEDLWAFNDERVVRAVAASDLPIICGVGHETDITLADLAADLRAPTPTAAAELSAPSRQANLDALAALSAALTRRVQQRLDLAAQRLDRVALRLARPTEMLARQRRHLALLAQRWGQALPKLQAMQLQRLANLEQRAGRAVPALLRAQDLRLASLQARLAALDPKQVLARGYAWLDDGQGRALSSVQQLALGAQVRAVLADGEAQMQVLATTPKV
ncbi:exodeoxyribonuclease VII large subunit [Roseateles oligotrophus]|uniref:Exodeoxyribonuclease 7 large subunit n=1 Tax=Roseateles oligotrophus TaxID=1769250 RepID=A0ABT2YH05_9BURK|nr:exodeoxyribonuclease VII large subunit [Roseateles oligotrophus]MCV2369313.1 exodeoxyribonuclease VII large subunit [Roseateles oligotrophus]